MALHVDFLSDTQKLYSGVGNKVLLKTESGEMEVLPHHVEFVVNLVPGEVSIFGEKEKPIIIKTGIGVAYKKEETLTILAEELQ